MHVSIKSLGELEKIRKLNIIISHAYSVDSRRKNYTFAYNWLSNDIIFNILRGVKL